MRVESRDGTEIACWASGAGPPLVLVHGAAGDHSRWGPLLTHLEPHATVHAMDRRGRGASGEGPAYDVAREYEDVAAVVDAVAEASGSAVDVYGHSMGGLCSFGAAPMTRNIRRLVLYEGWPIVDPSTQAFPSDLIGRLEALLGEGDRELLLDVFLREVAMMDDDAIGALRAQPTWQARVDGAHTIPRELRATLEVAFDAEHAATIDVPTLLLVGDESTDASAADVEIVAGALPDARIVVLEGAGHVADVFSPEVFARHVLEFLRES